MYVVCRSHHMGGSEHVSYHQSKKTLGKSKESQPSQVMGQVWMLEIRHQPLKN